MDPIGYNGELIWRYLGVLGTVCLVSHAYSFEVEGRFVLVYTNVGQKDIQNNMHQEKNGIYSHLMRGPQHSRTLSSGVSM